MSFIFQIQINSISRKKNQDDNGYPGFKFTTWETNQNDVIYTYLFSRYQSTRILHITYDKKISSNTKSYISL